MRAPHGEDDEVDVHPRRREVSGEAINQETPWCSHVAALHPRRGCTKKSLQTLLAQDVASCESVTSSRHLFVDTAANPRIIGAPGEAHGAINCLSLYQSGSEKLTRIAAEGDTKLPYTGDAHA